MPIPSFIKDAMSILQRGEVVDTADLISKLQESRDSLKDLKDKINALRTVNVGNLDKKLVNEAVTLMAISGLEARDFKTGVKALLETANSVDEAAGRLIDVIGKLSEKKFMLKTLTPKQSAIILYGQRITNATTLLNELTLLITYRLLGDPFIYKAREREFIETTKHEGQAIASFKRNIVKNVIKQLSSLSDDPETVESPSLLDRLFKIPGKRNFTGNPIFHIRKWWLDRQFEAYERNKVEKKLLGLKLAELKIVASGEAPPINIQEQIEYYEEQIQKYDRKIEEFRNDV